jgi:hypothetical protein
MGQETVEYIRQCLAARQTEGEIRQALLAAGHSIRDVNEAFRAAYAGGSLPAELSRLPSITALLRFTVAYYREHFVAFFLMAALPLGWYVLVKVVPFFIPSGSVAALASFLFSVVLFSSAVFGGWFGIAVLYYVSSGRKVSMRESYTSSFSYVRSYMWLSVVSLFVVAGGIVLFVAPGFIFLVWFILASYIVVAEGERGLGSLARSREYIRENFWGVVGRLIAFSLLLIPLCVLVVWVMRSFPGIVVEILGVVVLYLLAPLGIVFGFALYSALRSMKPQVREMRMLPQKLFAFAGVLGFVLTAAVFAMVVVFGWDFVISLFTGVGLVL